MNMMLSAVMIACSLLFLVYVIRSINRNIFLLKNAILWLFVALVLVIFAAAPGIPEFFSKLLGFETVANFLLFFAVIVLLVMELKNTITASKQQMKIKNLIQELSILKSEKKK